MHVKSKALLFTVLLLQFTYSSNSSALGNPICKRNACIAFGLIGDNKKTQFQITTKSKAPQMCSVRFNGDPMYFQITKASKIFTLKKGWRWDQVAWKCTDKSEATKAALNCRNVQSQVCYYRKG